VLDKIWKQLNWNWTYWFHTDGS